MVYRLTGRYFRIRKKGRNQYFLCHAEDAAVDMMDAGKTDMKEILEGSFCDPSNNCTWPTPNTGEELKIAASVICFHFFHG